MLAFAASDSFEAEDLVEFLDLWAEVEVLGDLLNALPAHGSLNDVFCSHADAVHRCVAKRRVDEVCWDL